MWKPLLVIASALAPILSSAAQDKPESFPTINVSAAGKISVKADLAILFMVIRSSAGLASDALAQNVKKEQEVLGRLTALGLQHKAKLSGNRFAPAAPPYYGGAPRPTPTGFEVSEYVYVFLEDAELDDRAQFEKRIGGIIDELNKAGAVSLDTPVPRVCPQSPCSVAFTVKDPARYLGEANVQAVQNARLSAEQVAQALRVRTSGISSVSSSPPIFYGPATAGPLDDLPYEFLSPSKDAVPISVSLGVKFLFQ